MQLSIFSKAKAVETKRKANCKNCFPSELPHFKKGQFRVVVSDSFPSRHLSLCIDCTKHEIKQLKELVYQLENAVLMAGK